MYKIILYTLFVFAVVGCGKKFLDKKPQNFANVTEAYSTLNAIQSALKGCYDGLQDYRYYGRNFYLLTEVYSDNAKLSSSNLSNFSSFYSYSLNSSSSELDGLWKVGYKIISRTNNVIESANALKSVAYAEKKQILGEAYALRALVYFDLIRVFAQPFNISSGIDSADGQGGHIGIPLILKSTNQDTLITPQRVSVKAVYNQIINDLLKADSMVITKNDNPYTFCSYSVKALISRVCMTMGRYDQVLNYSYRIISANQYHLVENEDYLSSWKQPFTDESILSISMTLLDNNGSNSLGYMLSKSGYGDIVATNDLYSLFSSSDIRKKLYQKGTDIYIVKYPGRTEGFGIDNIPIIRYSEIYYNFAESLIRLYSNDRVAQNIARGCIDTLLKRADINAMSTKLEGADLLQLILNERRKEFAFEGQRLFEIKRLLAKIERIDCNASNCMIEFPNYLFAMPIPISEINVNKNIKQNPGY